jgi:hypothetical protein
MKILTLAVLVSGALSAQDAGQLLNHVSETYKNLQSYHFESELRASMMSRRTASGGLVE